MKRIVACIILLSLAAPHFALAGREGYSSKKQLRQNIRNSRNQNNWERKELGKIKPFEFIPQMKNEDPVLNLLRLMMLTQFTMSTVKKMSNIEYPHAPHENKKKICQRDFKETSLWEKSESKECKIFPNNAVLREHKNSNLKAELEIAANFLQKQNPIENLSTSNAVNLLNDVNTKINGGKYTIRNGRCSIGRHDGDYMNKEFLLATIGDNKELLTSYKAFLKFAKQITTSYILKVSLEDKITLSQNYINYQSKLLLKNPEIWRAAHFTIIGDKKYSDAHHFCHHFYDYGIDYQEIPNAMQKLLEGIREIKDPIKRATELHLGLVKIHPWKDGNGRTARLIAQKTLMDNGLEPWHVIGPNYIKAVIAWRESGKPDEFEHYVKRQIYFSKSKAHEEMLEMRRKFDEAVSDSDSERSFNILKKLKSYQAEIIEDYFL